MCITAQRKRTGQDFKGAGSWYFPSNFHIKIGHFASILTKINAFWQKKRASKFTNTVSLL